MAPSNLDHLEVYTYCYARFMIGRSLLVIANNSNQLSKIGNLFQASKQALQIIFVFQLISFTFK